MFSVQSSRAELKWAFVQFIADVAINADCRPIDLKLALALIAELANNEHSKTEEDIFYSAE
ncbi:hypothetical protein [Kosakonia cowanii]|uniref:hypothetical protein n=1 Tax=Kosakonia cowanii TaxID=208223 RepID=UPI00320BAF4B